MSPTPLAVDIETVGLNWDAIDPSVQEYLKDRARTDEQRRKVPERLGLNPATGRVIVIGFWRPVEGRGGVLLEAEDDSDGWADFEESVKAYRGDETGVLEEFWRIVSRHNGRIITYNGRAFDGPFLMLRSVILGVEPTRNLVPYRYSFDEHCDLAEVVSFRGTRQRESLDFWCTQAGLDSPKTKLDGSRVGEVYEEGRIEDIARYCMEDVRATAELYQILEPIIELMEDA